MADNLVDDVVRIYLPQEMTLAQIERLVIEARLIAFGGNKMRTARSLGIAFKTLYNRLAEYRVADAKVWRG